MIAQSVEIFHHREEEVTIVVNKPDGTWKTFRILATARGTCLLLDEDGNRL